ncbi:MAG: amidohydrolase family protein [Gemmatimonadota bacterium]
MPTIVLAAVAVVLPARQASTGVPADIAIVDVNVVPLDRDGVLPHRTVVIHAGRIVSIALTGSTPTRAGATVVQGAGRYLMPGLIDAHVHLFQRDDMARYLDAGVTTVRNMWGTPSVRTLQAAVAAGTARGPTIISASPGLDGTPAQWPGTVQVLDSASARDAVGRMAADGWPFIKVYTQLTPPAYRAIMAAARDANIPVVGHVPLRVDVRDALARHQRSIEHLTGYDRAVSRTSRSGTWGWSDADTTRFGGLIAATIAAGTWNVPTLAIYAKLAEQQPAAEHDAVVANRRAFVRALWAAGAYLLVGTDAGIDVVAPGSSLHDELAEFVAAGLTPYAALRAATVDAADFLWRPDLGRVDVGATADLLLVSGNPLADVGNAAHIEGLVLHGAWAPRATAPDISGEYDTAVTLGDNNCGAVTVAPMLTTIIQRPGQTAFTLTHGPLTYHGVLRDGDRFATDTQTIALEGGSVAVAVRGTVGGGKLDARADVAMRTDRPCAYAVHWVGTRRPEPAGK